MTLRKGLVRGAMSLGGARVANSAFNAVTLLVLARLLTPSDFGIAAIASAVLYFIVSLTQFSIYQALVQREDVTEEHVDTAWTIALIRSLAIFAFFLLAAWPLALVYKDPNMFSVFVVTGLTGALLGLYNPHTVLAQKQMRFMPMAIFQVCKSGGLIAVIVLAFVYHSYWAIILGNLFGAALASLLSYFLIPYRPRFTLSRSEDLWGFSGWLFLNQLCETINWRFDQLAVSLVVPKAQMGIYSIAYSLAIIPTRETIHPLREILFPGLANLTGDREKLTRATLRAQATIALISTPLAIGLALVAEPAVKVMLGEQWVGAIIFVQVFCVATTMGAFASCFPPVAMALGNTRSVFMLQFWNLLMRIPITLAGLLAFGALGAALGGFVTDILFLILSLVYTRKLLGVSIVEQLRIHSVTIVSLTAMAVAVLSAKPLVDAQFTNDIVRLALLVSLGGATYVCSCLGLWVAGGRNGGPVGELIEIVGQMAPARFRRA